MWYRVVGKLQRLCHIFCHDTCHQQHVGMPRAGDKLNAQALDVVIRIIQGMKFQLTGIAGAGIHRTYA
jgi:hypothetical protein